MATRAELERARRVRAGVIGLLECCRCTYPLEHHETVSLHALECPAHGMTLSARAAGGRGATMHVAAFDDGPAHG